MDRRIGKGLIVAAIALAAGSSASHAQGPRGVPPNQERPDVVVSTVGSQFQKYGTVGNLTGYASTTVSCNIGTHNAIWIDDTNPNNPLRNQHPVIAQTAFRLKDGKFEQIGMSWLKHGWCAADAPSCPGGTYQGQGSCDWLGRFATDTYGADLNADQTDLGPRSEVNSWTGSFPYPYILNWNQTGNAIYKRLQINNDDLNPAMNPGALYWLEVVYIATDEWPEQRFNNGSTRRFVVGSLQSGGYNLSYSGATNWQQYAIQQWAVQDPSVTLTNVDAGHDGSATGGDGRYIVGTKVTNNGDGTWDYEYAIYNVNNNRAAQAFSMPVHCKVAVTDIGFHDAAYHSGELQSGADWTSTNTLGTMRWASETVSENPNANALRWSTLYNFRMTANTPPSNKTGSITIFKPAGGGPTALTFTVPGPSDPSCIANWNEDKATNSTDVSDFINDWFDDQSNATTNTDINCDGFSNSTDVSDFINIWFEALESGCV